MSTVTISGLDTGFLISTDDVIVVSEALAIPDALIKIQDPRCLFTKIRIARKNPASILPWFYGIGIEPSPNSRTTDGSNDAIFNDLPGNICVADA